MFAVRGASMIGYRSHITVKQRNSLLRSFCDDKLANTKPGSPMGRGAAQIAKVDKNTAGLWYRRFRETIYEHQRKLAQFHGVIEIDHHEFIRQRRRFKYEADGTRTLLHDQRSIAVFGILQRGEGPQD